METSCPSFPSTPTPNFCHWPTNIFPLFDRNLNSQENKIFDKKKVQISTRRVSSHNVLKEKESLKETDISLIITLSYHLRFLISFLFLTVQRQTVSIFTLEKSPELHHYRLDQ